jgi:hypothetical protein
MILKCTKDFLPTIIELAEHPGGLLSYDLRSWPTELYPQIVNGF